MRRLLGSLGFAALFLCQPLQASAAQVPPPPLENRFQWGQCTWWAANVRPDLGAIEQGNASDWLMWAQKAGFKTGPTPAPGAIAVFQPGADGALWTGHVARVLSVTPDGLHFTVDEMNFPLEGVVTERAISAGEGIAFIY